MGGSRSIEDGARALEAAEAALLLGALRLHLRPLVVGHLDDARLLVLERRPWEGPTSRGVLMYAVGQKYLMTAKRLVDSIRVHDDALPILVAHASGVDTKDGALYFGTIDPHTRLVAVPNPANEGRTERDRAGASHRAMGALRRGRFDVLGRSPFLTTLSARPANFVTEHTRRAKNCVLIHGHNLSAARHP